jgi:2-amino-4-hydroxy-6-hydroxymethyldihydropteridine diphosphokinase
MAEQVVAYLGLGSSLGDRVRNLQEALDRLHDPKAGIRVTAVSKLYESPHLGLHAADAGRFPPHLNAVARLQTSLAPQALLAAAQAVEAMGGRVHAERWGPRTIDVDLLLYGDQVVDRPDLRIPHPELARRSFVVLPLVELAPGLTLPDGTPVSELLERPEVQRHPLELRSESLRLPDSTK